MRTAYKCLAYPDTEQRSELNRTFGCIRYVWNRTLAWRHARYHGEQVTTSFTQASAYLTAIKATDDLAWLTEVPAVPLQQAIRHQQAAYTGFYAQRARYPWFKSRTGRHVIDRWYPSSKTCSACGHLLGSLSLKTRHWQCPSCGIRHDRDINAATNILAAGLAVAGGNPGDACGADVRPQGTPLRQSAVKQEPQLARAGIPSSTAGSSQEGPV